MSQLLVGLRGFRFFELSLPVPGIGANQVNQIILSDDKRVLRGDKRQLRLGDTLGGEQRLEIRLGLDVLFEPCQHLLILDAVADGGVQFRDHARRAEGKVNLRGRHDGSRSAGGDDQISCADFGCLQSRYLGGFTCGGTREKYNNGDQSQCRKKRDENCFAGKFL